MENKLEQLLNGLIEKGWKPRNVISKNIYIYKVKDKINLSYSEFLEDEWEVMHEDEWYSMRDLVSKSSGLWQFVCENNLNYSEDDSIYNVWLKHYAEDDHESPYTYASPVWYLIESSLKDESELEDFLLSNIVIKDE